MRVVALAVVLQLGTALVSATVLEDGEPAAPRTAPALARAVPPAGPAVAPAPTRAPERAAAVRDLLRQRARAVVERDRAAFLATVDPSADALLRRQAATFDALAAVPLSTWDYELGGTRSPPDERLDRRYGRGAGGRRRSSCATRSTASTSVPWSSTTR